MHAASLNYRDLLIASGAIDGVLSEYVLLEEGRRREVPAVLSHEEASTLPCAGVTAWVSLMELGSLDAESTVLTMGTGGVSILALQFSNQLRRCRCRCVRCGKAATWCWWACSAVRWPSARPRQRMAGGVRVDSIYVGNAQHFDRINEAIAGWGLRPVISEGNRPGAQDSRKIVSGRLDLGRQR